MTLPTDRTSASTVAQHVSDHNTAHARLNGFYSVAEFGAVGDGTTDDSTAIQDALDQAATDGGGTVFLTTGATHLCDTGLLLPYKVNLLSAAILTAAEGRSGHQLTVLKLGNEVNGPLIQSKDDGPLPGGADLLQACVIGGFACDGNNDNQSTWPAKTGLVDFRNITTLRIAFLSVYDSAGHGIYFNSCAGSEINETTVMFCDENGLYIDGATDLWVRGGMYARNLGNGIYGFNATATSVCDVYIFNNSGSAGLRFDNSTHCTFVGNRSDDNVVNGFTIKAGSRSTLAGNVAMRNGNGVTGVGIQLQATGGTGPSDCTIVGNFSGNVGADLDQMYGIELQGNAQDNTIVGNVFEPNVTAPALVAATATPNLWAANVGLGLLGDDLGVESVQVTDPASDDTALLLRVNDGGVKSIQQVSMGADDSGGAGFKVLRVPN